MRQNTNSDSFTTAFVVDQSPEAVFAAIKDVRGWWSEEIEGSTDTVGAEFRYHFRDIHRCTMKITELVPNQRVVWHVLANDFNFTKDKTEWKDTDVVFEIADRLGKTEVRFTHVGLVPEYECFDACQDGWTTYIVGSLKSLIATGQGRPNRGEAMTVHELKLTEEDFTVSFTVEQSPDEVFAAINDVRGWWSGDPGVEGSAQRVGDEFTYRYGDVHYSKQKVAELVPGRKVVWQVTEAQLNFVKDQGEWKDTVVTFDIVPLDGKTQVRFTHLGLVPQCECFQDCSSAWNHYTTNSLRRWIAAGEDQSSLLQQA